MKGSKKITGKVLGADKETILELVMKDKDKDIPLYNILGYAFKATVEDEDNGMGEYIKFQGRFKGLSFITGEEIDSGVLILPDIAGTMISGELLAQDDDVQKIAKISLTITVKYDKTSVSAYAFGVEIHNAKTDAFDELVALIPEKFLLPGQKEERKKLPNNGKTPKSNGKATKSKP